MRSTKAQISVYFDTLMSLQVSIISKRGGSNLHIAYYHYALMRSTGF